MKFNKKAFAFSFIALMLSFVIFAYASLYLFKTDINKDENFKVTRVLKLNEENNYFQEIYLNDALKFSLYNSLSLIVNQSYNDPIFYQTIQNNISKLNYYLFELITNSSLDSNHQIFMEDKTIYNLTKNYLESFSSIHRGEINFEVLSLRVFEKNPYYVDFQVLTKINLSTEDNVGSWNSIKSFYLSVPVYNLLEPSFVINTNLDYSDIPTIKSNSHYQGNVEWSFDILNETIIETYSTVFFEPNFKYFIGNSYLSNLLNISRSSYDNVVGFWSFDYDEDEKKVYDTSLYRNHGKLFGDTKIALSFENQTINPNNISDLTHYKNIIKYQNIQIEENNCIFNQCISLDDNSQITINETIFNINRNETTISLWFFANNYTDSSNSNSYILKYGEDDSEISVRFNSQGRLEFILGSHGGITSSTFQTNSNITLNTWNHLVITFNGNSKTAKIYINGDLKNSKNGQETTNNISDFLQSLVPIYIGSNSNSNNFIGLIDEFVIYNKEISHQQVADLFNLRKLKFVEYLDSLHNKGIYFNGFDTYVQIDSPNNISSISGENFSLEFWFKPEENVFNLFMFEGEIAVGYDVDRFFFRDNNGNPIDGLIYDLPLNQWNYLVLIRNATSNENLFYLNGNYLGNLDSNSWNPNLTGGLLTFGSGNKPSGGPTNSFFKGIIDEIKIYNRSLSLDEIEQNYFSYNTFAKGCCNTIFIMNSNKFGFNTSSFNQNISISSKLFFDYYFRNKKSENNILVYLENITSTQYNEKYYNAFFDMCLLETYNIGDYFENLGENMFWNFSQNHTGTSCHDLISKGLY